jgi:subtilisin family serine protease
MDKREYSSGVKRPCWRDWSAIAALIIGTTLSGQPMSAFANYHDLGKISRTDGERSNVIILRLNPKSNVTLDDINITYNTTMLKQALYMEGVYVVRTPDNADTDALIKAMSKDKRLLYAEVDLTSNNTIANPRHMGAWGLQAPPEYLNQTWVTDIDVQRAHALTRGESITVAVLDTGVQLDHPELAGNLTSGWDFVDGDDTPSDVRDSVDNNNDGRVDEVFGHGTHVAGIIRLIAPDARIMPIRVLDADGGGRVMDVADALAYAINNGANVINLSLGIDEPSLVLRDMLQIAASQGVVVVASAGNLNSNKPQYPGAELCAIGVSALSQIETRAEFSNYGSWVDFAAPGEGIYSTFPDNSFAYWSGTSMAAPFVSGQVALIKSMAPQLSARDINEVIRTTATRMRKVSGPEKSVQFGRLIDIGASVERVAFDRIKPSKSIDVTGKCLNK